MDGSVFLWVGTAGQRELGEIAIGMPAQTEGRDALSSSLLGEEVGAAPLARPLRKALALGEEVPEETPATLLSLTGIGVYSGGAGWAVPTPVSSSAHPRSLGYPFEISKTHPVCTPPK
ncbi:unnamed protein product, partial [Iphiclides podalirius]